ncbi:MAG TPA: acyl-CoA dehydrogenase family protein [Stellaceae bacterium]|nr:acyl-CoA dehydrogenase family protein [Stellaceae bacterium]
MSAEGAGTALAAAERLAPMIAAAGDAIEAARRLTPEIVEALHEAGLYRLLLPRDLGGAELDLAGFSRVIEALARADGSTAWCVCQANGCAQSAGFLEPQAARDVFGGPRAVLAWGPGRAQVAEVSGGWRISGEWSFASGCRQAGWLGCYVTLPDEAGRPRLAPDRTPLLRTFIFPASSAEISDVWQVIGLKGTASDAYRVRDLVVPAALSFLRDAPKRTDYPLYRFTINSVYMAGFPGVALGLARAMLADFIALAGAKTPRLAKGALREDALVQAQVAQCEARLAAARAFLQQTLEASWRAAAANQLAVEHRLANRLSSTHAIHEARAVADIVFHAAGATAIYETHSLERRMRDIITVAQHLQARQQHFATVGQAMLGLEPDLAVT